MSKEDIKTLTDIILDTQTQVAEQINTFKVEMDARLDASDARMDRFEGRMDRLEEGMRVGFDRVNTTLDGIAGRLDIDDSERVALSAQVDRHEDWIIEVAPVIGVPYTPGA